MNELQRCELDILKEIDRVCKKHGICYFLSCGTLLGAVRHKGFIPWDDDLDINMDAPDYYRFLKVAPKELSDRFFLQTPDSDWWYKAASKVRMNGTAMMEKAYDGIPFHQGVWVDVFPMTALPDDDVIRTGRNRLLTFCDLLLQDAFFARTENLPLKYKLLKSIPRRLRCLAAKAIRKRVFKPIQSGERCELYDGFPLQKPRFCSADFAELIDAEFEGEMFPIPKNYDAVLTAHYGDYMIIPPPEKRTGGHDIAATDLHRSYADYLPENAEIIARK